MIFFAVISNVEGACGDDFGIATVVFCDGYDADLQHGPVLGRMAELEWSASDR